MSYYVLHCIGSGPVLQYTNANFIGTYISVKINVVVSPLRYEFRRIKFICRSIFISTMVAMTISIATTINISSTVLPNNFCSPFMDASSSLNEIKGLTLFVALFQLVGISLMVIMSWPENQGILFFFIFLKHFK